MDYICTECAKRLGYNIDMNDARTDVCRGCKTFQYICRVDAEAPPPELKQKELQQ
jgi:hypothetical protein